MERTGAFDFLPKREAIRLRHEKDKLERNLGGMQSLERLPDAIFVIDTKKEHIAVNEARKLGISVIAIVDTNCDPDEVDFVIPGNDDAIRSVSLVTRLIADALAEGRQEGREAIVTRATGPEIEPEPEPQAAVAPTSAPEPPSTPEPAPQPEPALQPETVPTPETVPVAEAAAPEPEPIVPDRVPAPEAEPTGTS
jgi:small subunit ribosomal protein S2